MDQLPLVVLQSAWYRQPVPGTILPLLTLSEITAASHGRHQASEYSSGPFFAISLKVDHTSHSPCATPPPAPPSVWLINAPPAQAAEVVEEEEEDPVETALTKYGIITENPWEKGVK